MQKSAQDEKSSKLEECRGGNAKLSRLIARESKGWLSIQLTTPSRGVPFIIMRHFHDMMNHFRLAIPEGSCKTKDSTPNSLYS